MILLNETKDHLLAKILAYILVSENISKIYFVFNNSTENLISDIQSELLMQKCCSWSNKNTDSPSMILEEYSSKIGWILLYESIEDVYNNTLINYHLQQNNGYNIFILKNKPDDLNELSEAFDEIQIPIRNIAVFFLNEYNPIEIYSYNPFDEMEFNLFLTIKSNETSANMALLQQSSIKRKLFYDKLQNIHSAELNVYLGLDLGKVYRKFLRIGNFDIESVGGIEVYLIQLMAKLMNATLIVKLQDTIQMQNMTNVELLRYLAFLRKHIRLAFDKLEPVPFDIIGTIEENR